MYKNENNETVWTSNYFCGTKIPEQDIKQGYISYRTLATPFSVILCNDIVNVDYEMELVNSTDYNDETDEYYDIYQYYIIDNEFANVLTDYTDEIVYYSNKLNVYVWGVTHFGTSWDIVCTDIKLELNQN